MRKILITGGAGFIGSHLVDRLVKDKNNHILIYDNLFNGKRENIQHNLSLPNVSFIEADIRDTDALGKAVEGQNFIFHLGALSNVMNAVKMMDYSFTTNVVGTYNVLTSAAEKQVDKVIFVSSREVYGEPRYLPVDENHPLACKNSYGASKIAGETYCHAFRHLFDMNINILRLANVYGPRDDGRVIPIWIRQALQGEDITVFGGKQIIDFIWVDVVVDALLKLLYVDIGEAPVNIGSGQGTAILQLAEKIQQYARGKSQVKVLPQRNAEVVKYYANVEKMKTVLGILPPEDPLFGLPQMMKM